jgi:hypothetical protein
MLQQWHLWVHSETKVLFLSPLSIWVKCYCELQSSQTRGTFHLHFWWT